MPKGQFLIVAIIFAGCDSITAPANGGNELHIEAVTPNSNLTGVVNAPVDPVPTVRVTDQRGHSVRGVKITFDVGNNAGKIAAQSDTTDSNGLATVGQWILSTVAGNQDLLVRHNGRVRVTFSATAQAGPVAMITRIVGNNQLAAVHETLTERLGVRVVDAFSNPEASAPVAFTVISGNGHIEAGSTQADESGVAWSGKWTLGSLTGVQQVSARTADLQAVFSAVACVCSSFLFVRNQVIYKIVQNNPVEVPLTIGNWPAWSPDGQRIAFARYQNNRYDIYLMNADGSNIVRRTFSGGALNDGHYLAGYHSPTWSPDGRWLAVASGGDLYGAIYLLSVTDDGQQPRWLSDLAALPAWSPDGSKIAFVSLNGDDYGYSALHVLNADGSNLKELVRRGVELIDRPTWSPDGRRIAFSKCYGSCDIYTVGSDGSGLTRLTNSKIATGPAWSPDGAWIAATMLNDWSGGESEWIAAIPADAAGEAYAIISSGTHPAWQPVAQAQKPTNTNQIRVQRRSNATGLRLHNTKGRGAS